MNSSDRMSPWPASSILETSIVEDRSFLRIRQTPSSVMVALMTVKDWQQSTMIRINLQSSNAAAKLMHILPSHVPFPRLLTVPGIEAVSISSTLFKIPSGVLKPTMTFGTPRRKDCIQNFINFLSNAMRSRSFRMSAVVLSSTQLMGPPSVGFESHTNMCQQ